MKSSDSFHGDSPYKAPGGGPLDAPREGKPPYDPVYLHSLRELVVILVLFLAFFAWSITTSYFAGYPGTAGGTITTPLVLGMPAWAFWGVFFPWVMVDIVAVWFCFFYMKNDDLGSAHEGQDLAEQLGQDADREAGHE